MRKSCSNCKYNKYGKCKRNKYTSHLHNNKIISPNFQFCGVHTYREIKCNKCRLSRPITIIEKIMDKEICRICLEEDQLLWGY